MNIDFPLRTVGSTVRRRSTYQEVVPAGLRRCPAFQEAIVIRKKLVAQAGHFFSVTYEDTEECGTDEAENVIWVWQLPEHRLTFRCTTYDRGWVALSLFLEDSEREFDIIRFDYLAELTDADIECVMRRYLSIAASPTEY